MKITVSHVNQIILKSTLNSVFLNYFLLLIILYHKIHQKKKLSRHIPLREYLKKYQIWNVNEIASTWGNCKHGRNTQKRTIHVNFFSLYELKRSFSACIPKRHLVGNDPRGSIPWSIEAEPNVISQHNTRIYRRLKRSEVGVVKSV